MIDDKAAHWENVYNNKGDQEVSWFEDSPHLSLRLINQAGATSDDAVLDVGGAASRLVDALVSNGPAHVPVAALWAATLGCPRPARPGPGRARRVRVADTPGGLRESLLGGYTTSPPGGSADNKGSTACGTASFPR